jgi:hypothetical protein
VKFESPGDGSRADYGAQPWNWHRQIGDKSMPHSSASTEAGIFRIPYVEPMSNLTKTKVTSTEAHRRWRHRLKENPERYQEYLSRRRFYNWKKSRKSLEKKFLDSN